MSAQHRTTSLAWARVRQGALPAAVTVRGVSVRRPRTGAAR
ncbi:hypothetical protein [Streptomyces chryseus]|nr:hypothetical protein [Streptomyces chryseus]